MPKNPNKKTAKRNEGVTPALLLAGCAAEVFVLIVRRYYVNGTLRQVVAWDGYLPVIGWVGIAMLVVGTIWYFLRKKSSRWERLAACVFGFFGAFVALTSNLAHWNQSTLTLFAVLVPTATLLGILWILYDRECALALSVLGVALFVVWVCRRTAYSPPYAVAAKAIAAVCIAAAACVAWLLRGGKLRALLPESADPLPVYVSCGLSAAALLVAILSAGAGYYAMWCLALVAFGLVVYYTVKQL